MIRNLWAYVIGFAGVAIAILTALLTGKKLGKTQEQKKQAEKSLEVAKDASEIDDAVRNLSDAERARKLREHQRD